MHIPWSGGEIEICEGFSPYVKSNRAEEVGNDVASYVEAVRGLLAARKCVNQVFNPADAQLAMQMFQAESKRRQEFHSSMLPAAGGPTRELSEEWNC